MINIKKAAAAVFCCAIFAASFSGCDEKSSKKPTNAEPPTEYTGIVNYTPPEEGEDILVLTLKDYGDIKIKLFPEEAPKGVENILGLTEKKYYDGLIFHRIISDFMIQGGDPEGSGRGGESIWGGKFDGGISPNLIHAAGAVAYANSGSPTTNGSQFYIVTGTKLSDQEADQYKASGIKISDDALKIYKEDGGAVYLDGRYTVFGQVFDGLDKVFEVQKVETDANDKPLKDVVIESMRVEKYDGSDVKFHLSDY